MQRVLEIMSYVSLVLGVLAFFAPVVGRFVAPWSPRLSESLIRLGADLTGVSQALKMPADHPVVPSALPLPKAPAKATDSQPPGGAGAALLLLALSGVAAGLSGCGGTQELAKYAEAGRDLAEASEPCLVAQKAMDESQCGDDQACQAKVKAKNGKLADALDLMHSTWCKVSPSSEGCP